MYHKGQPPVPTNGHQLVYNVQNVVSRYVTLYICPQRLLECKSFSFGKLVPVFTIYRTGSKVSILHCFDPNLGLMSRVPEMMSEHPPSPGSLTLSKVSPSLLPTRPIVPKDFFIYPFLFVVPSIIGNFYIEVPEGTVFLSSMGSPLVCRFEEKRKRRNYHRLDETSQRNFLFRGV